MKSNLKKLMLIALALSFSTVVYSQLTFSVQPGLTLNGANFGYQINQKFVPYLGLQYVGGNGAVETSGERTNFMTGQIESFTETAEASVNIIIPTLGLKYFFYNNKPLKAYGNINLSKPILTGSSEQPNSVEDPLNDLLDEVSLWAGEVGIGAEYYFHPTFSLGGEFGLRWLRFSQSNTYTNDIFFDPNTGQQQELEATDELSLNLNPTYARISLNFYFQ